VTALVPDLGTFTLDKSRAVTKDKDDDDKYAKKGVNGEVNWAPTNMGPKKVFVLLEVYLKGCHVSWSTCDGDVLGVLFDG
jgi:hypothetical protein